MKGVYLHINSRDEFLRINAAKIVCFEADGNYTHIVLANQLRGVVGMNLGQMQQFLVRSLKDQAAVFARVGKRHIINHTYVYHIHVLRQKLVLSDGEHFAYQLSVSKNALKRLKDAYGSFSESDKASKTRFEN